MSHTATPEVPTVTPPASPAVAKSRKPKTPAAQSTTTKPKREPARSTTDTDGVNEHGLVVVENSEVLEKLPIFYYTERGRWYAPNGKGSFGHYPDGNIKAMLAVHGHNRTIKDMNGNTPAERAMLWLMQNHAVAYAGSLAGFTAGLHSIEGTRILVTESPRLPEPKAGDCQTIRGLIETQFEDSEHDQASIVYTWLASSFRALWQRATQRNYAFRHCPALAIFGPRRCGKTALIDLVISPLFGGKKADPLNYMREGKFNKDLIGASLLVLDDKGASANLNERRQRGECLKDLIWKPEQRMEGKNADALMLTPWWRMVIAGNDDDAGLQICPALSPSLQDKIIIVSAKQAQGLPTTDRANDEWAAQIKSELPAFASFLLDYNTPPALKCDERSRVVNFWHPAIVSALRDMQPEMKMLELIDSFGLVPAAEPYWEGTATEFERIMRGHDKDGITDRLFVSQQAAGRMLSELWRMEPERVQRTNRGNTSFYRIRAAVK